VKVTEISVRPVTQSIAQLRAAKEQSSIHSQHRLDSNSIGGDGLSQQNSRHIIVNSHSQHIGTRSQRSAHSPTAADGYNENMSQNLKGARTVTDLLQERITQFISKPNGDNKTYQQEIANLNIENDMVNTFFDEIHKMSDHFTYNFVEFLKQDLDSIIQVVSLNATE
jgi:hypothetical protein